MNNNDTVCEILSYLTKNDHKNLRGCSNFFRNVVDTMPYVKELCFINEPDIKLVRQHSVCLKSIATTSALSIKNIELPVLEELIITSPENGDSTDFSMYNRLKRLGISSYTFEKIDSLKLPRSVEILYMTYQIPRETISFIINNLPNLKLFVVYHEDMSTTTVSKKIVEPCMFTKKWGQIETSLKSYVKAYDDYTQFSEGCCELCKMYIRGEDGVCRNEYCDSYNYFYTSSDDEGDYDLSQYNDEDYTW